MGSASKENSFEFPGVAPSALAEASRYGAKRASKENSGTRRALAPKPTNSRQPSFSTPQRADSKRSAHRTSSTAFNVRGDDLGRATDHARGRSAGTKKPKLDVMEEASGDETTEDEGGDVEMSTPLANLAARRTQSRSKVLYPRPHPPKDLSTLELDFVTAPQEPSLDEYTKAYFETMAAHYLPPPSPEITMDDFPDLEVDISSSEDECIPELKTPLH